MRLISFLCFLILPPTTSNCYINIRNIKAMPAEHKVTEQASADGSFKRQTAQFRNWISKDGPHPPEAGRYIVYAGLICPWASRVLHVRSFKHLESVIDVAIVDYELTDKGWTFNRRTKEATGDPLFNSEFIREIYFKDDPNYNLRYTIPVLFDKKLNKIVSNESSEIIRMLNEEFDDFLPANDSARGLTFYPKDDEVLTKEIDRINDIMLEGLNNGVYKTGFAKDQGIYEKEVTNVFKTLDYLESYLAESPRQFLIKGSKALTESDIRLYVTLIRFDVAYVTIFRCNLKMIRSHYPHLHEWLRRLYWDYPEFQKWSNFYHIKNGYAKAGGASATVPLGPVPDILPKEN